MHHRYVLRTFKVATPVSTSVVGFETSMALAGASSAVRCIFSDVGSNAPEWSVSTKAWERQTGPVAERTARYSHRCASFDRAAYPSASRPSLDRLRVLPWALLENVHEPFC